MIVIGSCASSLISCPSPVIGCDCGYSHCPNHCCCRCDCCCVSDCEIDFLSRDAYDVVDCDCGYGYDQPWLVQRLVRRLLVQQELLQELLLELLRLRLPRLDYPSPNLDHSVVRSTSEQEHVDHVVRCGCGYGCVISMICYCFYFYLLSIFLLYLHLFQSVSIQLVLLDLLLGDPLCVPDYDLHVVRCRIGNVRSLNHEEELLDHGQLSRQKQKRKRR